jgi:pilus assembly protein CpaB
VTSGVSGFLRPGDRVDVYWTGAGGESTALGREITKLIETNVKIIAVDQIADTDRTAPVIARTVTVEATPQEVAALAQAQSSGRLSLSLVGAEDDSIADVVQVDQRSLLGIVEEAPEVVEKEEVCTTKVRRGAEVVEQVIPCTN